MSLKSIAVLLLLLVIGGMGYVLWLGESTSVPTVPEPSTNNKVQQQISWSTIDYSGFAIPYLPTWSTNYVSKDGGFYGIHFDPPLLLVEAVSSDVTNIPKMPGATDHSYLLAKSPAHSYVGAHYSSALKTNVHVYQTDSIAAHGQYGRHYIIELPDRLIHYTVVFRNVTDANKDERIISALGMDLEAFESQLIAQFAPSSSGE